MYVEEDMHCGAPCLEVLDGARRLRLSRLMSAVLRHVAPSFGLRINRGGWVPIRSLVEALKVRCPWLKEEHVVAVAMTDPKGRFEVKGGLIRARYGHSLSVHIDYPEDASVNRLYHGTVKPRDELILREGIKPMKRRMVHLSPTIEDALLNASRWRGHPIVIEVDAERLRRMGFKVYRASPSVYLTPYVPPSCIVRVIEP